MRISTRLFLLPRRSPRCRSSLAPRSLTATSIVIGTDATYPLFESLDAAGKFVGFDIDIANALCDQMKVKCTFVNQDFVWHHSGPASQEVRRHRLVHVDHARA